MSFHILYLLFLLLSTYTILFSQHFVTSLVYSAVGTLQVDNTYNILACGVRYYYIVTKSDSYRSRNDLNHVCYSDSVRQIKTTYTSMILMGWNPYSPILKICVSCYFSFGIYIRYIVPIGKYCFLSDFLYCSFILLNLLR